MSGSSALDRFYARQEERKRSLVSWHSAIEPEPEREPEEVPPLEPDAAIGSVGMLAAMRSRAVKRRSVTPYCESPIEADFAVGFLELPLDRLAVFIPREFMSKLDLEPVLIVPQWPFDRFRFDFFVCGPLGSVLVECDGKQFHSSSEQQLNDQRKDAAARVAGFRLFRFRGSELFRSARDCAAQVAKAVGAI